ncbi:LysR family transcriptional regulator [Anaerosphaera multitolerans]|uniref:LysR family transcriptional regulator n=1 Tax=Anaerosphaera multitolerans TaxID=2487351 RepID=A0A437S5Z4_9FIRM|nr:LysR family transcriptional regulator [Anaerosphaera multitolerans]RVU54387.1 LysR family transcriptional regulator [Anaerosphaera multitolerans]
MNLQQIQYVDAIAHFKSMNKAAQHLFVSQPTLSQSIKDLEEEIGITIFERSRKGVLLTEDGIEFLRISKNILSELEYIQEHYVAKSNEENLQFQVSSQHYAFVVDAFLKFLKNYEDKDYVLSLKETRTLATIDDVYNQKSALGVIFLTENNKNFLTQVLEKKSLEFHQCHSVKPHVFLNNKHPLASQKYITKNQLVDFPMVCYEQNGEEALAEELSFDYDIRQKIVVYDRGTMLNVISNSNAYNIGTGYLISHVIPKDVKSIPLKDVSEEMCLGWIHLKDKKPSILTEEFIKIMNESLKSYSP